VFPYSTRLVVFLDYHHSLFLIAHGISPLQGTLVTKDGVMLMPHIMFCLLSFDKSSSFEVRSSFGLVRNHRFVEDSTWDEY